MMIFFAGGPVFERIHPRRTPPLERLRTGANLGVALIGVDLKLAGHSQS